MASEAPRNPKRDHEKSVSDELLKALQIGAEFVRMGDDRGEPDVIYRIQDKTLGIEVGTAYYDESDAKQEWTLARGERAFPQEGFERRPAGVIRNPDKLICEKVQHEIDDKCSKSYAGADEIWLCIEQRAPLSDAVSVAACVKQLKVPRGHRFRRILIFYLASLNDGGNYTAVRIV
jgi:hypothetical protein